ncbi:MAG: hypothetical protein V1760_02150 [Candidatus Peregrinibacteria bacterium]
MDGWLTPGAGDRPWAEQSARIIEPAEEDYFFHTVRVDAPQNTPFLGGKRLIVGAQDVGSGVPSWWFGTLSHGVYSCGDGAFCFLARVDCAHGVTASAVRQLKPGDVLFVRYLQ